jgi:hypothetical protein
MTLHLLQIEETSKIESEQDETSFTRISQRSPIDEIVGENSTITL